MIAAPAAATTPNSCCRRLCEMSTATSPPVSPPTVVATSSSMPRRRLISERPTEPDVVTLEVAMMVVRLMPTATRIGTSITRTSRGTRNTPPPRPSSDPSPPAAIPPRNNIEVRARDGAGMPPY